MRRLKLNIEYDGTPYSGWQRVNEAPSVQQEIETAWQDLTGEDVNLAAAGRTDKGVHALGQVAHVDTAKDWPLIRFLDGLNKKTSSNIFLTGVEEVTEDFHARFSATARKYRYLLWQRRQESPVWVNKAGLVRQPLDATAMQEALQYVPLGEADWSSFRSSECQSRTPMCYIHHLSLRQTEPHEHGSPHLWVLEIEGNHFLHHMVRIIMGTLVEVGQGKRTPASVADTFAAKNRQAAGHTFSPSGLYLLHVTYPPYKVLDRAGTFTDIEDVVERKS